MISVTTSDLTNYSTPQHLSEDSCLLKLLTTIPFIGLIPSVMVNESLVNKISFQRSCGLPISQNPTRLIELLHVQKDFELCNVIRNLIAVCLVIVGIVVGFFSTPLEIGAGVLLLGVSAVLMGLEISYIGKTLQMREEAYQYRATSSHLALEAE